MDVMFPLQPYNRLRESGEGYYTSSLPFSYVATSYGGTVSDPWKVTGQSTTTGNVQSTERILMADVVTPEFKKLVARGAIINSPMERQHVMMNRGLASYYRSCINRGGTAPNYYYTGFRHSGHTFVGDHNGTSGGWVYPSAPWMDFFMVQAAITDAWANVSLNDAQILVQIAEFEKTMSGLISLARRALKIFRAVRKLDLSTLGKEFNPIELKNRYLELRYGLRPIVFDMVGLLKALTADYKTDRRTYRGFKMASREESFSNVKLFEDTTCRLYGNTYATRTLECRAGVLTAIESFTPNIWGTTEILQTIWEIIPWSFIIDWFFKVGKLIASWSPKFGFKTLASWYVVTDTTTLISTVTSGESKASYSYQNTYSRNGTYSKTIINKYRLPNPDRPMLPEFAINLNSWKILDLGGIFLNGFKAKDLRF